MGKIALKRTSLYASGASPVNLLQARFYNEDCLVYDLEDSVPAQEKDAARLLVYNLIKYQRPVGKYVIIRVNGIFRVYRRGPGSSRPRQTGCHPHPEGGARLRGTEDREAHHRD